MSGPHKVGRRSMRNGMFPIWKTALLLILLVLALLLSISAVSNRRRARQVDAVEAIDMDKLKGTVACPACRRRFAAAEFKDDASPNMRSCPNCKRQIPLPYIIRQTAK